MTIDWIIGYGIFGIVVGIMMFATFFWILLILLLFIASTLFYLISKIFRSNITIKDIYMYNLFLLNIISEYEYKRR